MVSTIEEQLILFVERLIFYRGANEAAEMTIERDWRMHASRLEKPAD
jgi:hypothetical protein